MPEITVTLTIHTPELATAILALADTLGDLLNRSATPTTAATTTPAPTTTPTEPTTTPATSPAAEKEIAATTTTTPTITLEEVRAALAKLSQAGKTAAVKSLLEGFGATKLTEVKPEYYSDLMARAKQIA